MQDINKKNIDHDGTRTHNLPLRRRAPYPLGHAVTLCAKEIIVISISVHIQVGQRARAPVPAAAACCALALVHYTADNSEET
jgi:hypothetical protein